MEPTELTLQEQQFMDLLKKEGIISVRELDEYSIMVAESLSFEGLIQKVSTRNDSVYIYPCKDPFSRRNHIECSHIK